MVIPSLKSHGSIANKVITFAQYFVGLARNYLRYVLTFAWPLGVVCWDTGCLFVWVACALNVRTAVTIKLL